MGAAPVCKVVVPEEFQSQEGRDTMLLGLCFLVTWAVVATVASLLTERLLKDGDKVPFYTQKLHMEITGIAVNIACAFLVPLYIQGAASNPAMFDKIWWRQSSVDCHDGRAGFIVG